MKTEFFYREPLRSLYEEASSREIEPKIAYDICLTRYNELLQKTLPREKFYELLKAPKSIDFYLEAIDRLRLLWIRRTAISEGHSLIDAASNGDIELVPYVAKLDHASCYGLDNSSNIMDSVESEVISMAEHGMDERIKYFTGYHDVDTMTRGLDRTEYVAICGRPGERKTSFMLNIAVNRSTIQDGLQLIFSKEMSRTQVIQKIVSIITGVSVDALRFGVKQKESLDKIREAMTFIKKKFYVVDSSDGIDMQSVRSLVRRYKPDVFYFDYLQLVSDDLKTLNEFSRNIKYICDLGFPCIMVAALNRRIEGRSNESEDGFVKPTLADIKECGQLEYDATKVIVCIKKSDSASHIYLLKNRFGPADKSVPLKFDGPTQSFSD